MSIFSGVNNPGVSLNQFTTAQYNALITFSALTDPGADRILGWDHTDNGYQFFTIGSGLTYTHATHTLTSSGGSGGITIGTTTITSGTSTRILYDNAGVVGEYTLTGSGTVVAMATSPSFTTPTLGVATATSINKVAITAPATSSTLVIADGKTFTANQTLTINGGDAAILAIAASKTLTVSNTMTLAGGDSTSITFPNAAATMARTDAGQTFTGTNAFGVITATTLNGNTFTTGTYTLTGTAAKTLNFTNSLTLSGTDTTTMTFPTTSATIARTDAANTFTGHQTIEGVTSTGATGTGKFVFDGTPTLVTPVLGVATATSINKVALTAPASSATLTIADGKTLTVNQTMTLTSGGTSSVITFPNATDTVGGLGTIQTWTAQNKFNNIIDVNNAVTVTSNAGTVPVTFRLSTFTNSSAATMAITMATASAVDGQMTIVRIYDFSAVAQTIGWTNTEDSTVTAPTTSNGSTTLPLTVGFMFNTQTTKWRCIAKA